MCVCVVLCAWRTRLLHLGAAADYFPSLGWWRRGARAVHPLGAAGLASNKTNKGHPVVTNLGDTAAARCSPWRVLWCPGTSPPPIFCLDVFENVLCTITIPVQLLWYFGLLYCVFKSMFGLSCFCKVVKL